MTTNQTIDGVLVPRELLNLFYRALNGGDNQLTGMEHGQAFRELRALLDAPAKLDLVECDACPTSGGCVSVCMKAPKPAAQPQGDLTARDQRADELEGLLRLARQFVVNGIDLGYIQMPDTDTPDPAHDLVPKIDAALKPTPKPRTCCGSCPAGCTVGAKP